MKIHHDVQPHLLGRCLGIHYDQFTYPKNVRIATTDGRSALTHDWMELVTCDTATPLAHYDHPFWGSYAAVTENAYQRGSALYLGAFFDDELLEPLIVSYFSRHGYEGLSEDTPQFPLIVKRGTNDFGKKSVLLLQLFGRTADSDPHRKCGHRSFNRHPGCRRCRPDTGSLGAGGRRIIDA